MAINSSEVPRSDWKLKYRPCVFFGIIIIILSFFDIRLCVSDGEIGNSHTCFARESPADRLTD